MSHDVRLKNQVQRLRTVGVSIPSLSRIHGLPKSTISLWVRGVALAASIQAMLKDNTLKGRAKGRATMAATRAVRLESYKQNARQDIEFLGAPASPIFWRQCAALLFWCEGSKLSLNTLRFTNSDPRMMRVFLRALREGFHIDEKRFRALIHVHDYHDDDRQKDFWSRVTGIPVEQFFKSYRKRNTGKRKRVGYEGCMTVSYMDATIARKLSAIYHVFVEKFS